MKRILLFTLLLACIQAEAQIIITGFMSDPKGTDQSKVGSTSKCNGNTVTHLGGYEYIQFMAVEDIDFSVTPYSVVVANNGLAQPAGWATGGGTGAAVTFKFNLTSGAAAKGTFFYVGSSSKVIAGYDVCGSVPMSTGTEANWIRSLVVYTGNTTDIVGDGFGHSTPNLLGSGSSNSVADGIAVFEGTTVTPSSIPIDAVFWGHGIGAAYRESGGSFAGGYQIPDNDIYSRDGGATPYFGMGSNTTIFPQGGPDLNEFCALGGTYDLAVQKWLSPRTGKLIPLTTSSTLADIESGTSIIQVLPVVLAAFSGRKLGNSVQLRWKTASELNNSYFEVLRSGGNDFNSIGRINGKGTSNLVSDYSFTDFNPLPGTSYYRLRQVDFDGTFKESDAVSVKFNQLDASLQVYGSSETGELSFTVMSSKGGTSQVKVHDLEGRLLKETRVVLQEGFNKLHIPARFNEGIYILSLLSLSENIRTKFIYH